jgi:hypothetical protein
MLQIARLEPAPAEVSPGSAAGWELGHRLVFIGLVLMAAGLLLAGFVYRGLPDAPRSLAPAEIRRQVESLTPLESAHLWADLLRGLDLRPQVAQRDYREALDWAWRWFFVAAAVGLAGIVTLVAALLASRPCATASQKEC